MKIHGWYSLDRKHFLLYEIRATKIFPKCKYNIKKLQCWKFCNFCNLQKSGFFLAFFLLPVHHHRTKTLYISSHINYGGKAWQTSLIQANFLNSCCRFWSSSISTTDCSARTWLRSGRKKLNFIVFIMPLGDAHAWFAPHLTVTLSNKLDFSVFINSINAQLKIPMRMRTLCIKDHHFRGLLNLPWSCLLVSSI